MAPARPATALLGALLLAGAAREAAALRPAGDAAGNEAPALEKEEWPRRRARGGAGQLLGRTPGSAWMTGDSLRAFGQGSETVDDLDLHDGPPPAAGCYMRMASGCPEQPMRTQAWRRDKMATERGLDEEGCHRRKQVWERYCGSEDAEMLYVSGLASSGPVSALQVGGPFQSVAAWWPWGKKHESTTHESTNDETVQAVPPGEVQSTTHEITNDDKVQAVPLGEVVITHAGSFKDEYLYASQDGDSYGGRFVHAWMNGSLREDPQARWNISKVGGNYVITHAGSFKDEYLFASQHADSRGGFFVHTWTNGSLQEDPQAHWNILTVGGNFVITHAGSATNEYLCATQHSSHGWRRFVHTQHMLADDPQAFWTITPVAKERAPSANAQQTLDSADSDVLVGYPTHPGCYMRMPSGCPKKPMDTHMWRLDAWAEDHELDKAGCETRKSVWDRYCDADDAKIFFVPKPPMQ